MIEAVSMIIEEDGFTKIGINHIARRAKCDKILIYRYFGGLDGLLLEWAKQYDYYSFAYYEFSRELIEAEESNFVEIVKKVLRRQMNYLKGNYLMQELYIWELSGNSSFKVIQEEREKNGHRLQEELEKRLETDVRTVTSI